MRELWGWDDHPIYITIATPTGNEETIGVPAGAITTTITHPSHHSVGGEVMVIGQGDVGQLGLGEEVLERKNPAPVIGMKESATQVVCGGMHTVALTKEGKVRVLMAGEGVHIQWLTSHTPCSPIQWMTSHTPCFPIQWLTSHTPCSPFRCTLGDVMMREHWDARHQRGRSTFLVWLRSWMTSEWSRYPRVTAIQLLWQVMAKCTAGVCSG